MEEIFFSGTIRKGSEDQACARMIAVVMELVEIKLTCVTVFLEWMEKKNGQGLIALFVSARRDMLG